MKFNFLFAAALIAGAISTPAATANATALSTNSTTSASSADAMTTLFGDPVIAKGNGFEIKRSELDTVVTGAKENAAAANQQLPPDFDISVLNQLITIQLLLQKATPADRAIGQQQADEQFTNLIAHFGSQEAFARQLKMVGMTEDQLRAKAAQEATAKAVLARELNVSVTDAQIKEYYSNHASAFAEPEKVRAEHILLMTTDPTTHMPLSTNVVASKRKLIEEILKQARAGTNFADLAKQYSEDPGSKEDGGELPKFGRGDMVPEFEAAAFALQPGQISDVVTTMYGFHIIKVLDKSSAKQYGLTENISQINKTPAALIKAELESEQLRQMAPAYVQKLRAAANVQILDPSLKLMEQSVLDASTNAP